MIVKEKLALTSDRAGDLKGAVYAVSGVIVAMDPGWDKTLLLLVFLLVMAMISYCTVGNIPPDKADYINDALDPKDLSWERIEDVLKTGRRR